MKKKRIYTGETWEEFERQKFIDDGLNPDEVHKKMGSMSINPAEKVEVFSNNSDLNKRKEYLESLTEAGGLLSPKQYIYAQGNALMRITYNLTPDEAVEYEKAFNEIMSQ